MFVHTDFAGSAPNYAFSCISFCGQFVLGDVTFVKFCAGNLEYFLNIFVVARKIETRKVAAWASEKWSCLTNNFSNFALVYVRRKKRKHSQHDASYDAHGK